MQCLPKLENGEKSQEEEKKAETRTVTSLVQWITRERNLLIKIATEHGLTIENPNEKREHQKDKEEFETEKQVDQNLEKSLEIANKSEALRDATASSYYTFADDIKFEDARLMAAKGNGQGLCHWFNGLGHKFGAWLHKAEYFAKTFWKKTPDELIEVAEDMRNSYCNSLGEYIEKGMKAQPLIQIKATREIKDEVSQVKKKSRIRNDGWEW